MPAAAPVARDGRTGRAFFRPEDVGKVFNYPSHDSAAALQDVIELNERLVPVKESYVRFKSAAGDSDSIDPEQMTMGFTGVLLWVEAKQPTNWRRQNNHAMTPAEIKDKGIAVNCEVVFYKLDQELVQDPGSNFSLPEGLQDLEWTQTKPFLGKYTPDELVSMKNPSKVPEGSVVYSAIWLRQRQRRRRERVYGQLQKLYSKYGLNGFAVDQTADHLNGQMLIVVQQAQSARDVANASILGGDESPETKNSFFDPSSFMSELRLTNNESATPKAPAQQPTQGRVTRRGGPAETPLTTSTAPLKLEPGEKRLFDIARLISDQAETAHMAFEPTASLQRTFAQLLVVSATVLARYKKCFYLMRLRDLYEERLLKADTVDRIRHEFAFVEKWPLGAANESIWDLVQTHAGEWLTQIAEIEGVENLLDGVSDAELRLQNTEGDLDENACAFFARKASTALQRLLIEHRGQSALLGAIADRLTGFLLDPLAFQNSFDLNVLLMGGPGMGKTTVAVTIARLFADWGMIAPPGGVSRALLVGTRADLVSGYEGQTTPKATRWLYSGLERVIFIDEAYTIKTNERDGYGDEALGALVKFLDDNKGRYVCIAAGYRKEMMKKFVGAEGNPGLQRRFHVRVPLQPYSPRTIVEIFNQHVNNHTALDARYQTALDIATRNSDAQAALVARTTYQSANAYFSQEALLCLEQFCAYVQRGQADQLSDTERKLLDQALSTQGTASRSSLGPNNFGLHSSKPLDYLLGSNAASAVDLAAVVTHGIARLNMLTGGTVQPAAAIGRPGVLTPCNLSRFVLEWALNTPPPLASDDVDDDTQREYVARVLRAVVGLFLCKDVLDPDLLKKANDWVGMQQAVKRPRTQPPNETTSADKSALAQPKGSQSGLPLPQSLMNKAEPLDQMQTEDYEQESDNGYGH
jgi:hypothetical protein